MRRSSSMVAHHLPTVILAKLPRSMVATLLTGRQNGKQVAYLPLSNAGFQRVMGHSDCSSNHRWRITSVVNGGECKCGLIQNKRSIPVRGYQD